jgi:hypothetical protein
VPTSDADHPDSLLSRIRAEVGRRRLPFRVVVSTRLAALAATGAGVIYVADGRPLGLSATLRTVLHEIEGHALPRARALSAPLGIFAVGSARGSDDQEGRALGLERGAGLLGGERKLELARRHLAGRMVEAGADFVDTARFLERETGASIETTLRIAARAHRGPGLARELVYLPAYLRLRRTRHGSVERVMAHGQIAVDAVETLKAWV